MRAMYDSKTRSMNDRGIRELLTDKARFQSWLDMEAALAQAQGELGMIPAEAAKEIAASCKLENIDLAQVAILQEKIGHGFVPFLKTLIKACPDESGKYVHYGVTTQNIQQSAQLLQTRKIHQRFILVAEETLLNLAKLARKHHNSIMPGRTHGRHALPITYGYKVSVWIDELMVSIQRLRDCEKRVFRIMMGGAVGAFNASGEIGLAVQKRVAELLDMYEMDIPSRNIGVHKVEYVMNLTLMASGLHKMAEEIYSASLEEIGEVSESFSEGTIGSSTMPHKINPKLAKGIIANSQKLYSLPAVMLTSCCRPYEGDSSSYMLQDATFQEALELMTEIILRAEELSRTIQVNTERMKHNAYRNHGLDNSEYIMMKLANRIGKDQAHTKVYELSIASELQHVEFRELLLEDSMISERFSESELTEMLKPESYTGLASYLALTQAEKAERSVNLK